MAGRRTARVRGLALFLLVAVALLTGCGLGKGVYELPLPGGADVGADPLVVVAEFGDVLDLVPHSSVKLDHVDVGRVVRIEIADGGRAARVHMEVRRDLELPVDTSARIQQTSLLGEKYVALTPGVDAEPLVDGAELPLSATSRSVSAEEVLGALSMLLDGGGVGRLETISKELQSVAGDRSSEIRSFLTDLATFVKRLAKNRDVIAESLEATAELSAALNDNQALIERTLEDLTPGVEALSEQQADMVRMMATLDDLSEVTVATLRAAGDDIVADLELLAPVLNRLARAGKDLPNSLELMLTFPFTDEVLHAIKGDYFNAFITMAIADKRTGQPRHRPAPDQDGPRLMLPGGAEEGTQ